MIRILIAEDSRVVAMLLKAIIDAQPGMTVVGTAHNGREAVHLVRELKPDLVTMDIRMPVMDGLEATREIMESNPLPIVIISASVSNEELNITFRALEAGALAVIEKPYGPAHAAYATISENLTNTIWAMAEVKVVRRRKKEVAKPVVAPVAVHLQASEQYQYEVAVVGCSTGGPQALHSIIGQMPADYPLPVLVAQHISPGFISGMAEWLDSSSKLHVKLAEHDEILQPATIYLAPDDRHLIIHRSSKSLKVALSDALKVKGFRPSATPLFRSAADACGRTAIGVILTGMGDDGAEGLLSLRQAGGRTIAQDEKSCVVFGMPGSAIRLNAVERVLDLNKIASSLSALGQQEENS
jgi:two-component system chemotaxis response regulator CheB